MRSLRCFISVFVFIVFAYSSFAKQISFVEKLIDEGLYREARSEAWVALDGCKDEDFWMLQFLSSKAGVFLCRENKKDYPNEFEQTVTNELIFLMRNSDVEMSIRTQAALLLNNIEGWSFVVYNSNNRDEILTATCFIYQYLNKNDDERQKYSDLYSSILLFRGTWNDELRFKVMEQLSNSKSSSISSFFSNTTLFIYRNFISGAIGSRCILEPSCSSYFMQCSKKHGLLCIPMTADRFFREPQVSSEGEIITRKDEVKRVSDPVSNHDFWFHK